VVWAFPNRLPGTILSVTRFRLGWMVYDWRDWCCRSHKVLARLAASEQSGRGLLVELDTAEEVYARIGCNSIGVARKLPA
jgi:hypothetical protein